MENEFIPYEQALELKELGFNKNCLARFDGSGFRMLPVYDPLKNNEVKESWFCVTPLYQQAFKWFREKYKLEASIQRMPPEVYGKGKGDIKNYLLYIWAENLNPRGQQTLHFDTYEEAELECLKKLIEIVKKKQK